MARTKQQPKPEEAEGGQAPSPGQELAPGQLPRFVRAPEYRTIYTDLYRVRLGNGDVALYFSRTDHEPGIDVSTSIIKEEAEILMSWGLAKILAQHLSALVVAVEAEIGEIPMPAGMSFSPERQRDTVQNLGLSRFSAPNGAPESAQPSEARLRRRNRTREGST